MLKYLKNIEILKSNRVVGLHCLIDNGNKPLFSYILLLKKKGRIEIEHKADIQCEFEKLSENIPAKFPVYLSIEGKGILNRRVEHDASKPVMQQAIPNANETDFIYEEFDGPDKTSYISLARRDYLDDILEKLSKQKFSVIGLTISPFSAIGIFEIFPQLPVPFKVGCYELDFDATAKTITDFRKLDLKDDNRLYSLGDNEISSSQVLPFYHALNYYTNGSIGSDYSVISNQKKEYISKRLFGFAGWFILIFLFISLLVNALVFTSLSDEKQRLGNQVSGNTELLISLKHVKEELSWKEKFLGRAGTDHKKWFSYFADQIGASVPEEITLEKLDLRPVNSKIINLKEIELQTSSVRIEGITKNSQSVNNWALILKKMQGISNVIVESYSQIDNTSTGVFIIKITLTNSSN
jgi:Tfp pilus assembly protein PilN